MNEMISYPPPAVTSNAPTPGINPGHIEAPVMYPPASGPGYPPTSGYLPAGDGYRTVGGYSPSAVGYEQQGGSPPPITNPPAPGAGYPPPGTNYPPPGMQPQTGDGTWMPAPVGVPMCPPGLEYLTTIDQLIVNQTIEFIPGCFNSYESKNKYSIKNSMDQKIYTTEEEPNGCKNWGPVIRSFDMKIKDSSGNEIIHLYRRFRCVYCCCPCCLQVMEVMSPPGTVIGTVVQEWTLKTPNFSVKNADGETVLRIEGPPWVSSICGDVEFKVLSEDGETEVGLIRRQWSGFGKIKDCTVVDNFGITFPLDLDVAIKAVLLGACMLIDFVYYEKEKVPIQTRTTVTFVSVDF